MFNTLSRSAAPIILSGLAACASPAAPRPESHLVSAGERLAGDLCGECHAIGAEGRSALAEAPPFRVLRADHSRSQMDALLRQRMVDIHPQMPVLKLDPDQLTEFLDYWQDLETATR